MTNRSGALLLAALVACGPAEPQSAFEAANLEPPRVLPAPGVEGPRVDASGLLSVDGEGPDFSLSVSGPAGVSVDVFTPSGAELGALAGQQVRLSLVEGPEGWSLAVRDVDGAVVYLLEPVGPGPLTTEIFGPGLVAAANDLGAAVGEAWEVRLSSAWLRTDAGDLELLPGEPAAVDLLGASYRALLVSSYDVRDRSADCDFPAERLSYELFRTDDVDRTPLTRDPDVALVGGECAVEL